MKQRSFANLKKIFRPKTINFFIQKNDSFVLLLIKRGLCMAILKLWLKQYVETLNYSLKRKSKLIDEEVQYFNNIPLFNWIEISQLMLVTESVFCPKSDPKIAPDTSFKMETSLIQKLANELVEVGFKGTVAFAGYGEPLLAKNIYEMVKILSPVCNVEIVTNGDPLKPKIIDKCFDAGVNKLVVSMYDGPHQVKHFEELFSKSKMPKDKYVLRDRWYKEDEGYGLMLTIGREY